VAINKYVTAEKDYEKGQINKGKNAGDEDKSLHRQSFLISRSR
jgi:hypothetical protein